MEYKDYNVEDFVLDNKFRRWILEEDHSLNAFWAEWLQKYPHKIDILKEARKIVINIPNIDHHITDGKIDEIWKNVEGTIKNNATEENQAKQVPFNASSLLLSDGNSKIRRVNYGVYWRVAAIFIFAFTLTYVVVHFMQKQSSPDIQATNQWTIKSTALGQKMRFFLSDGSEVVLNAGSTLKYQKYFTPDKRELLLSGEGYFKVAKDVNRPFTVKTSYLETTALGTEFNVKAYDKKSSSVALAEGKVEVIASSGEKDKKERFVLMPGEGVKYESNNAPSQFNFDRKQFLLWKDGVLYFQKATESEVFNKLEHWYGVKIIPENKSSKRWGFSGEFHNKSLEAVMKSLGFAMDFTFKIANDSVNIQYN